MSTDKTITVKLQIQSDSKSRMFGHDNELRGVVRLKDANVKRFLEDKEYFMATFMWGADSLWKSLHECADKT